MEIKLFQLPDKLLVRNGSLEMKLKCISRHITHYILQTFDEKLCNLSNFERCCLEMNSSGITTKAADDDK